MARRRSKRLLVAGGSIILFGVWLLVSLLISPDAETVLVSSSFRQRLEKQTDHHLLKRQQTLNQRSIIKHDYSTHLDIYALLPWSMHPLGSGFSASGDTIYVSGEVQLQGESAYYPERGPGSASFHLTSQRSVFTDADSIGEYTLDATLLSVWSGTDTRIHLSSIDIHQSGRESVDLLMRRGLLQEYENKRILTNWSSFQAIATLPIFSLLAHQQSQHVIPTRSGEVVALVEGQTVWLSGIVSLQDDLTATLRFPDLGIRLQLDQQGKKHTYALAINHYRMVSPLLQGEITFDKNFASLTSTFDWTWTTKEHLIRTWTHRSTFTPTSFLSVDLPKQRTPWTAVQQLREDAGKAPSGE